MLSKRMNGHWSICAIVNSDLPVPIHTKSQQLPFQECRYINIIYKHTNVNPYHVHCHLKWHTNFCSSIQTVSQHKHLLKLSLLPSTRLAAPARITSVSVYSWFKPQFKIFFLCLSMLHGSLHTCVRFILPYLFCR
jgi:hypothetical protein